MVCQGCATPGTIVRALRANGEVVGMTGDGVNDAPAKRLISASAWDQRHRRHQRSIRHDPDGRQLQTIIAAIREGRIIYDNIRKFIRYLLGCNVGEVLTMFAAVQRAATAADLIQILWMNLVTDGPPSPDDQRRRHNGTPARTPVKTFCRGYTLRSVSLGF